MATQEKHPPEPELLAVLAVILAVVGLITVKIHFVIVSFLGYMMMAASGAIGQYAWREEKKRILSRCARCQKRLNEWNTDKTHPRLCCECKGCPSLIHPRCTEVPCLDTLDRIFIRCRHKNDADSQCVLQEGHEAQHVFLF